jgi:hypothetical protein
MIALATFFTVALVCLGLAAAAAFAYGSYRWRRGTLDMRRLLEAGRIPVLPARVDFAQLAGLPAPVQRYLRRVLTDGAPMVATVQLQHIGTMNLRENSPRWSAFTSDQQVVTGRPGFDWDARISMLPGVTALVHDAYINGEGRLRASLYGLITVASLRGTEEMARGELLRFLAEAVWYPTVLLPGQGVSWDAVDAQSARATLTDGAVAASLRFLFGDDGLVVGVHAEARGRTLGATTIPTPWHGRFWRYEQTQGMLVPQCGEVGWMLESGLSLYWKGEIATAQYRFAC